MTNRFADMNLPHYNLLSDGETRELIIKAQQGDSQARDTLVQSNLRLVFNLIQRFFGRGYEMEDLFQIGTIGLMKAIDKFDLSYDVKFSTYAVPMIVGEIRRFLRDDNVVKVSRTVKETANKIFRVREDLTNKLGREPSVSEIGEALELPKEEIVATLEASQTPTSIYETLYQDEGDPIYVLEQIENKDCAEDVWFDKMALKDVLMKLTPRDRMIIMLRFYDDQTQTQVAERLGLSQVQISRLERQALNNLKRLLTES